MILYIARLATLTEINNNCFSVDPGQFTEINKMFGCGNLLGL